jgi:hypothetical protein
VGDYAIGKDSGTIDLVLVGDVNEKYLRKLLEKVTKLIHRGIKIRLMTWEEFEKDRSKFESALLIWKSEVA